MRIREPINAWSHLIGLLLAAVGTVAAAPAGPRPDAQRGGVRASTAASLILLYAASTRLPRPAAAGPPAAAAPDPGSHRHLFPDRRHLHPGGAAHAARRARAGRCWRSAWAIALAGHTVQDPLAGRAGVALDRDLPRDGVHGAPGRGAARRARSRRRAGVAGGRGRRLHGRARSSSPASGRIPCPAGSGTTRSGTCWCWSGSACHFAFMLFHVAAAVSRSADATGIDRRTSDPELLRRPGARAPSACSPPSALAFVAHLTRRFAAERDAAARPARARRQRRFDAGRAARLPAPRPPRCARATGPWPRPRRTSTTGGWRSPAPPSPR